MCGIAFVFCQHRSPEGLSRDMERCMAAIQHRGPDGSGVAGGPPGLPWIMGHRRLAVIDVQGSPQPMSDVSGRYTLSYNGELYNYKELRDQLSAEWNFQTRGDVEVVLAGLVVYGVAFLNLMEGMWALALWDRDDQVLLLVRDRMGQKPLYFQSDGSRFACASELGALKSLSWFPWQEDARSTADYLRYGYYLPGTTAYQKVREVLPGHWLKWQVGRAPRQKAYWSLAVDDFLPSAGLARSLLQDAVVAGVRQRLVADVEVGALLSGGVDSSLVTGIIRRELKQPLKTFTMGFSDPTYDERRYARRMARWFHCEHFESRLRIGGWEPLQNLVLDNVGQPFADGSLLPTALVCQMASEQVKVVVSGDGGDELFSGYQRYLARFLLRWYTRLPKGWRHRAEQLLSIFPEPVAHHSASLLKKAHLFVDVGARMEEERTYAAPLYYTRDDLARLAPELWRMGHPPPVLPTTVKTDDIYQMMAADALVYLPQDILTKVDRASMAFSLEVRSPLLDRRVVELAFAMPRRWHRRGLKGKRMLWDCFSGLLPDWAWNRRKHGFGVPVHQWFRSGLERQLRNLLHETRHPLAHAFVEQLISAHLAGRRDHGQRLWQIYVYLLWRAKGSWRIS